MTCPCSQSYHAGFVAIVAAWLLMAAPVAFGYSKDEFDEDNRKVAEVRNHFKQAQQDWLKATKRYNAAAKRLPDCRKNFFRVFLSGSLDNYESNFESLEVGRAKLDEQHQEIEAQGGPIQRAISNVHWYSEHTYWDKLGALTKSYEVTWVEPMQMRIIPSYERYVTNLNNTSEYLETFVSECSQAFPNDVRDQLLEKAANLLGSLTDEIVKGIADFVMSLR